LGKNSFSFPPHARKQGRGRRVAGGARAAALGLGGGHGEGEKGEGSVGIRFAYQLWAEVACGGGSMAAVAGRLWSSRAR